MKKILLTLVFISLTFIPVHSQAHRYRDTGYQWSISYTNMTIIWNGIETSHGYMINEHHYIGAGAGFLFVPSGSDFPAIIQAYADYHAYWYDDDSTPFAGIKLGYMGSIHPSTDDLSALEIEPCIGWSWTTKSGFGLSVSVGEKIITTPVHFTESSSLPFTIVPSLSFSVEF